MNICITGSSGLIGSAASDFLLKEHRIIGIDNNMRKSYFGEQASTQAQTARLVRNPHYLHINLDIRNKIAVEELFHTYPFDVVIHCAAQPSHDRSKDMILTDFEVNTLGTIHLLDALYQTNQKASFIFTSTNKVYGDSPNTIPLKEQKTRYVFKDSTFKGFDETSSIDQCTHSFFGASKTAADIYVQEYGRYLGLKTAIFRLGCVTGAHHAGVKLHGFLSYLVKSLVHEQSYEIIGYKGKQVRDQIHAEDVARAFVEVIKNPPQGEVFNMGGGMENSASVLELISLISKKINIQPTISYNDQARVGDHICYITNFTKFRKKYPNWGISRTLESIVDELIAYEQSNS